MIARFVAFLRCRRAGAMLFVGAAGLTLMASVGAMMTNYAWQEAQFDRVRGALRASLSASAGLLKRASNTTVQAQIKERVADFLRGLVPGMEVDDDDITVEHDAATNETWVTVGGTAKYAFTNFWGGGGGGGGNVGVDLPSVRVGVAVDISRYEIAVATDLSDSMRGSRMRSLQAALRTAIGVLEDQVAGTPGSMAAAIVPFGHAVNVADTSGSGATEGKARYARILTGASVTTTDVSDDAKGTDNHYYDMYGSYGRSMLDMSSVISKRLPITEATPDWNLREDESIDVSALMPATAATTWSVNGLDFWNGCVMARWGAYWDAGARPTSWDADELDNNAALYPAKASAPAWGTGGTALAGQPLHISDTAPSHGSPATRFIAYSFPDSFMGGTADARVEAMLKETLTDDSVVGGALVADPTAPNTVRVIDRMRGFNDWGRTNQRRETVDGEALCPTNPVLPLTDVGADLRTYTDSLTHVPRFGNVGVTYLHLGVVWGLRALSPLWQSAWGVSDSQGTTRPLAPCYGDNSTGCARDLKKTIVILSDGGNNPSDPAHGRASRGIQDGNNLSGVNNPVLAYTETRKYALCGGNNTALGMLPTGTGVADWKAAALDKTPADFNARFSSMLDTDGTFNAAATVTLANDWREIVHPDATSTDIANWSLLFDRITPWQLFRGEEATIEGSTCSISDAFAGKTPAGCAWTSATTFTADGRPTQRPGCRPAHPFGPYGNIDDFMRVSGSEVVSSAAPFQSDAAWTLDTTQTTMKTHTKSTLDGWFAEACQFAGDRDVSIVGIFFGDSNRQTAIAALESCVDKAGGTDGVQDVHIAPTEAALQTAFREIFTIRANLRFLN